MKIVFVSNYFNHHQSSFCREMDRLTDHGFTFIETEPMDEERLQLGWEQEDKPDYVKTWNDETEILRKQVEDADALIVGGSDDRYVLSRLKAGKLTFRVEENIFKNGWGKLLNPHTWSMLWKCHYRYQNKPVYMLCASSNLPGELKRLHLYKGKMLKWGYFPEVKWYEIAPLLAGKNTCPMEIVWCARFIDWKHPEDMITLAKLCREQNLSVHITMIGDGVMFDDIKAWIEKEDLKGLITAVGAVQASSVRSYMEKASVFIATSGREEGWGAVLNEAMNSGCICFAKREMGAAEFLIKPGKNGFVYESIYEIPETIRSILNGEKESLREAAYRTVVETWNGKMAAERLYQLAECVLQGKEWTVYADGPCSSL